MKRIFIGIGSSVILIGLVCYFFFITKSPLSPQQSETRKLLGNPDQFVVTYLPSGGDDSTSMVRQEVWYYAAAQKQISFLGGKVFAVEPYHPDGKVSATDLFPEQFDASMDIADVADELGNDTPVRIADLPVFDSSTVQTYLAKSGLFIIENGMLTYMQTLEPGDPNSPVIDVTPTPVSLKIQNNVYGFSITLPTGWNLGKDDIVLSSYDTGYLSSGGTLPSDIVKCDFVGQDSDLPQMQDEGNVVDTGDLKIDRQQITDNLSGDMGYGDGTVYRIVAKDKDPLYLVCFALSDALKPDLEQALKTFVYDQ